MDVKEAVKVALEHAKLVFENETPRLEEVWFDDDEKQWCVTVGLQRSEPETFGSLLSKGARPTRMHYKTVRIQDETQRVVSVRNHDKMPVSPL